MVHDNEHLARELSGDIRRTVAAELPAHRRANAVVIQQPHRDLHNTDQQMPPDELRRNAIMVSDSIQRLLDSERELREGLNTANARIEQYQRAEQAMAIKLEAALLDIEVERRRTEKVREAFTALRVRMEGIGRLAADSLAELREDDAS